MLQREEGKRDKVLAALYCEAFIVASMHAKPSRDGQQIIYSVTLLASG